MPHSRFFLSSPFQEHTEVLLTGDEAHHLQHVMRKREGENVELVNGHHQLALATILRLEKKGVWLRLDNLKEKSPPAQALILCQAICRFNRLDTIVEKGTELGMTHLWLFPGQLSEKKELSATQLHRLHAISIAAMKQSGRLDLPQIILKEPLLKWEAYPEKQLFFGDTAETAPDLSSAKKQEKDTLIFIGPESGFTSAETEHLVRLNAVGIRLHTNILRTDTAAIAALSQIFLIS